MRGGCVDRPAARPLHRLLAAGREEFKFKNRGVRCSWLHEMRTRQNTPKQIEMTQATAWMGLCRKSWVLRRGTESSLKNSRQGEDCRLTGAAAGRTRSRSPGWPVVAPPLPPPLLPPMPPLALAAPPPPARLRPGRHKRRKISRWFTQQFAEICSTYDAACTTEAGFLLRDVMDLRHQES